MRHLSLPEAALRQPDVLVRPDILTRREGFDTARRQTSRLLVLATAIGGLGLAAGGTAGVILGVELTGNEAAAGLPVGLLVIGTGAGALLIARGTGGLGRGRSLALGYALGAIGALLVIIAAVVSSISLFLVGSTLLGAANAALFLTRYAAAAVDGGAGRGSAIGTIFLATAAGAVASPLLLGPSGGLAVAVRLPPLTGLFLIAAVAFGLAGCLLAGAARSGGGPGGAWLGPETRAAVSLRDVAASLKPPQARLAIGLLAVVNLVMVAVMATVPVHLAHAGHSLGLVGLIISLHVAGMFMPSPASGRVADRFGATSLAAAGLALLALAGVTGLIVEQHNTVALVLVLIVLGAGWNGGVIGGSLLLTESVLPRLRPDVEGLGEVAMSLAAATGAPLAGLVVAVAGFPAIALLGAVVALTTLGVMVRIARR